MRDIGHAPTPVRDGWARASERDAAVAAELNVVVRYHALAPCGIYMVSEPGVPGLLELDLPPSSNCSAAGSAQLAASLP